MRIKAGWDLVEISVDDLEFYKGRFPKYETCYYEIDMADISEEEIASRKNSENDQIAIEVTFDRSISSRVYYYIYGGQDKRTKPEGYLGVDRQTATTQVIPKNKQPGHDPI